MITEEQEALMAEIIADPIALQMLKDKCIWEAMSRFAVLQEWSDPRTWPDYKRRQAEELDK